MPVGMGRVPATESETEEMTLKVLKCESDLLVTTAKVGVDSTELGVRVSSCRATEEVANTSDGRTAEEEKADVT